MNNKTVISVSEFSELCIAALKNNGFTDQEARDCAAEVVDAQCRGLTSHGAEIVPWLIREWKKEPAAGPIEIRRETPVSAFVEGNRNIGSTVSIFAMDLAMKKADANGFGLVGVNNNQPFILGRFNPTRAAREGFVALNYSHSTVGRNIAPHGSADRLLSLDPLSIAVPTDGEPVVMDMTWTNAGGAPTFEIKRRRDAGESIPEGWAIGPDGRSTTEAQAALDGAYLSFGGHKSSGLLIMSSLLVRGLLGELATPPAQGGGINMVFLAFRSSVFVSQEDFLGVVSAIAREIRGSRPRPGFDEVLLPGERGDRWLAKALADGIEIGDTPFKDKEGYGPNIPRNIFEELNGLA